MCPHSHTLTHPTQAWIKSVGTTDGDSGDEHSITVEEDPGPRALGGARLSGSRQTRSGHLASFAGLSQPCSPQLLTKPKPKECHLRCV